MQRARIQVAESDALLFESARPVTNKLDALTTELTVFRRTNCRF